MRNLIQALPFYDRLSEQDRFKENSSSVLKFLSKPDTLIPFQISIPLGSLKIDYIKIKGFSCEMEPELQYNTTQVVFQTTESNKWVVYKGAQFTFTRENGTTSPMVLKSDYYYFEISVDGRKYYSEMFYVPGEGICDRPINVEIEAWHHKNVNGYTFDNGFHFKAYFNSLITNITSDVVDEFLKNGYEMNERIRRVVSFTHNIELDPMPNSIAIGLAAITAFKNVIIRENGNEYIVKDITYKQDQVEGEASDTVLLSFTIFDQDIVTTDC